METQHWITTTVDCGYVQRELGLQLFNLCLEIGRLLGTMKARSAEFCPKGDGVLRELPDDLFTRAQQHPFEQAPATDN